MKSKQAEKPQANDTLGGFELVILASVLALGDDAYGMTIQEKAEELSGRPDISIGAIYTTLDRLEKKGFATSAYGDPSERGRRPRKYYRVDASGEHALRKALRAAESVRLSLQPHLGRRMRKRQRSDTWVGILAGCAACWYVVDIVLLSLSPVYAHSLGLSVLFALPTVLMLGAVTLALIVHFTRIRFETAHAVIFVGVIDGTASPPPGAPAYVLELLLHPKQADAVIGDLEERFPKMCAKYGVTRARRWFRWQVTRSAVVFLWELMKVLRWTSLLGIAEEAIRRRHF